MNRRERRVYKRKMRRVGAVLASMAMLGATAGLGGIALAEGGGGGGTGGGCGQGGCGGGGIIEGPGTGSGFNVSTGQETLYCNGHLALLNGPPAHDECDF
jgi:hypothetical protein